MTNTALQSIITESIRKKVFWMDTEAKNIFCIFYATLLTSGVSALIEENHCFATHKADDRAPKKTEQD